MESGYFKNPMNGHIERAYSSVTWLWVLLFGFFYWAVKGVWTHAVVSALLGFLTGGLSWLVYPFFAKKIIRNHYLKRGWKPMQISLESATTSSDLEAEESTN